MEINFAALSDWFGVLITGSVGGAISGALVANHFTNQRHRTQRKTTLFAFLSVWESEIEANRKAISRNNAFVGIADQFDERRLFLIEKAAPVEFDFWEPKRTRFKGFVEKIRTMTPGEVEGDQGRQVLLKAVRELKSFLDKN